MIHVDATPSMMTLAAAALLWTCGVAAAQPTPTDRTAAAERSLRQAERTATVDHASIGHQPARDAVHDARRAAEVVREMDRTRGMSETLRQAKAVFVATEVPARSGTAPRGRGVLIVRHDGHWGTPAFYDLGAIDVGAAAGADAAFALILNSDRAVQRFMQNDTWMLDANAGLTVTRWHSSGASSPERADIVVWSSRENLFGGAVIGVMDVAFDRRETAAFYERPVSPDEATGLSATAHKAEVSLLREALQGGRGGA